MAFKDNRDFIKSLLKTGDAIDIKREVDWDVEAGAISRRALELSGPATLFSKIKDYPEGRIFGGVLGTYRRVAIALGLPPETPVRKIYEVFEERQKKLIPPVIVKDGPCKENKMLGNDIDLYEFPTPMVHEGDGGRYIATWAAEVSKDPDSDWVNWGMYRFMIVNQNTLAGYPSAPSHLGTMLREKYVPRKMNMPIAIAIGPDPISALCATTGFAIGQSEAPIAGALRQEPVELVKCETSDLMVPATSEMIIEGEILYDRNTYESPYGEYTGYRSPGHHLYPVMNVKAVTYRNGTINTMANMGMPPDDSSVAGSMGVAIGLKNRLIRKGLPVVDCYVPPEGASHLVVISVSKGGTEVAKAVKEAISGKRIWYTKVMVVNDDVDVFNMYEVIEAFAAKNHSSRGIFLYDEPGKGSVTTPAYNKADRDQLNGALALFDCTFPLDWREEDLPIRSSFRDIYSKEVQEKVLNNWSKYGFKK